MKRFVPLTRKINLIIISSLVVGLGIVIVYFAYTQNLSLRETSRGNLRQQSDILFQSIKNAMLPGEAPIAVQLFEDIRLANPAYKIFLLRDTGVQAFSDNSTVEVVNANLGYQAFSPKEVFPQNLMVMEDDQNFSRSVDWEFCFDCHANANEPHPYGDGNQGNEFRDYVFHPYRKQ